MNYENANNYITYKLGRRGPQGHSPLLGYAFDWISICGPIGYDIDDGSYVTPLEGQEVNITQQTNIKVKLLRSSYTGSETPSNPGIPTYVQGSGDLDICNGIFSITPEYPKGIFHYVCTIDVDIFNEIILSNDNNYGYLNNSSTIVKPTYPYIIGAYKGVPEISNFNTQESINNSLTSDVNQITTYTINFKTLKTVNNRFNGDDVTSIQISQDDNYINLRPNPHPYIWNFTNNREEEDAFCGLDNKQNTYIADNLKSLSR